MDGCTDTTTREAFGRLNGLSIVLCETRATKVESAVDNLHVSVVQGVLDNFLVFFNLHQSNSSVQMGNVRKQIARGCT